MQIKRTAPAEFFCDSYVVEIQTMLGYGNVYRDFTVGPFKRGEQEASLQSLLETLGRMAEKFPHGMGGIDNYDDVLGYYEWFCAIRSIEGLMKLVDLIARDGAKVHHEIMSLSTEYWVEWHMDAIVDCLRPERLTDYEVFYYDEAGMKHTVQTDPKKTNRSELPIIKSIPKESRKTCS
jgi:hypothetical protein